MSDLLLTGGAPPVAEADAALTTGRARRPSSPLLVIGLVLIALLVLVALLAPVLTPYDPKTVSGRALERPSARHWLGTDKPGRDLFTLLVYGARVSLAAGVVGGSLATLGAILIGVLPALLGRGADGLANRLVIFLLALPGFPLLVLVGALADNKQIALIIMIGIVGAAPTARLLRSEALSLRERGFIAAARGLGGGPLYVLRRHLVPGLGPLILIGFVNWASTSIGLQAGLAFLGLGDPRDASWGMTLNRALLEQYIYFSRMWTWWVLPPGFAITLALLGFTFVGVALEPVFNPRWRRSS